MKAIMGWISHRVAWLLSFGALIASLLFIYLYKLSSLIPGKNIFEAEMVSRIDFYQYPWRNIIDAPFVTLSWITSRFTPLDSLEASRIISAALMVFSVLMFYLLLRNWFLSPGKALVGTTLFATSSWTLVLARGAHSVVAGIFLLLLVFTLSSRTYFTTKPFLDWAMLTIAICLSLYTPLAIWIIFIAGMVSLLHIKQRQRSLAMKLWQKLVVFAIGLALTLPLLIGIALDPSATRTLLGVDTVVTSIQEFLINAVTIVSTIFFFAPSPTAIGLGRLPFLDIFSLFMFMLGVYYFERRLGSKRSKLIFGALVIGIVVCSLGAFNIMRVSLLLPLVYIFIAAGVHESIRRWLAVFPRNPLARTIGILVLAIAIGFTTHYQLSRTFIARPGNPDIRELYLVE